MYMFRQCIVLRILMHLRGYAYGTRFNAHSVSYEGIRDYVYIIPQISREKTD